jgi:hypothetical protein
MDGRNLLLFALLDAVESLSDEDVAGINDTLGTDCKSSELFIWSQEDPLALRLDLLTNMDVFAVPSSGAMGESLLLSRTSSAPDKAM